MRRSRQRSVRGAGRRPICNGPVSIRVFTDSSEALAVVCSGPARDTKYTLTSSPMAPMTEVLYIWHLPYRAFRDVEVHIEAR